MSEKIYYRSTAPEAAAFYAEIQRRGEAYRVAVNAFLADYPDFQFFHAKSRSYQYGEGLVGEACPGDGWRRKPGCRHWSPDRRVSAGKRIAKRLRAIRMDYPPVPGMPEIIFSELAMCQPGFAWMEEALWVVWGAPAKDVERCPSFNRALWTRVSASTYWLAQEAKEAQEVPHG